MKETEKTPLSTILLAIRQSAAEIHVGWHRKEVLYH